MSWISTWSLPRPKRVKSQRTTKTVYLENVNNRESGCFGCMATKWWWSQFTNEMGEWIPLSFSLQFNSVSHRCTSKQPISSQKYIDNIAISFLWPFFPLFGFFISVINGNNHHQRRSSRAQTSVIATDHSNGLSAMHQAFQIPIAIDADSRR